MLTKRLKNVIKSSSSSFSLNSSHLLSSLNYLNRRNIQQEKEKESKEYIDIQLQPRGIQHLLSDSNLHETYKKYLLRSTYSATTNDISDAWGLPPEVYIDDAFYRVEQEKVFKQSWIAIGHKSSHLQNDGDVISTFIGTTPILITNYKGELKGFYNVCRHRGSILLDEGKYTNCNVIRCPYHSWGYSCSGKLRPIKSLLSKPSV